MKCGVALASLAVAGALHYEKPPCASDEIVGSITGTNGTLCAPKCDAQGKCPTDVPPGTWNNATGACVLTDSSSGEHYCALGCKLVGCPTGAHCAMIGIIAGVCVYPDGTQANAGPAKNFVMKQPEVSHPSLPTMWTATVKEDEVGVVHESEHFVAKPTEDNPSAKWTNYTDGSCQRLIREGNNADRMRYLLGCDAVSCCKESGEGPIEYQIPNVHPEFLAHVKNAGKEQLTLFDGSTVEADHWTWSFTVENYNAYTTLAADGSAILHKWLVNVSAQEFPNEYVDFKAVPAEQEAAFVASFQIPAQCTAPNTPRCDSLHKTGKLSDKSIGFLRNDKRGRKVAQAVLV